MWGKIWKCGERLGEMWRECKEVWGRCRRVYRVSMESVGKCVRVWER